MIPDVIQPSPSSENQGWGCSNERATGTACGSYPRAKQSAKTERERDFGSRCLQRLRGGGVLTVPLGPPKSSFK